ncbi:MAG: hypothetical protein ACR65R_15880 [Methylomicrobium sp.]
MENYSSFISKVNNSKSTQNESKITSDIALGNSKEISPTQIVTRDIPGGMRAIGAQQKIANYSALYDQGANGQLSDIAGGPALTYRGTIVPENPQKDQITEAKFLDVLAEQLAYQIIGLGMGDGPDPEFVEISRGMIEKFVAVLVPSGVRMENIFRSVLGLPESLDIYQPLGVFTDGLLSKIAPVIKNLELITRLAESMERWNNARGEDEHEEAAMEMFSAAGIMFFSKLGSGNMPGDPPPKYPFREFVTKVGNEVHSIIQAHYWHDHPEDVIMFEDFIVAGPNLLAKIWDAGTWKAPYEWLPRLRAALMTPSRPGQDTGSTKRPDILNLTKAHLYEIKTNSPGQVQLGLKQVAEYHQRLTQMMPDFNFRLAGFEPTDWRPFPIYYAGGNTLVMAEVYAPGLITYQRIGSRVPVLNPLRFWSKEKEEYYRRQAARVHAYSSVALAVVAFMGCLALGMVIAPAAAAAGGAIGGTAAEIAAKLSIASRLAAQL